MNPVRNYLSGIENKALVYLISFLLLISPIAYSKLFYNASHIPRMVLLSIVSILGVFSLLYSIYRNGEFVFHKIHAVVLLFLTWATLSIIWTVDYGNFAYEIINLWGYVGLFFITTFIADYKNIKFLYIFAIAGATYACVIALLQNYGLNPSYIIKATSIMHSTFGFKNHFALYLDLIVPLILSFLIVTKIASLRWIITMLSGVIMGTLLELHTRGSWLTLLTWIFLSSVVIFYSCKKSSELLELIKQRKLELMSVFLIAGLIFTSNGLIDEKWQRPIEKGEVLDTSSKDRLIMYYNSLGMIKDKPFTGVGFGAFWKGFREYMNHPIIIKRSAGANYVYRLHNDPLQYFTEIGIPGGTLYLVIFFSIIYMGSKLYRIQTNPYQKILILGLLMSVIASFGHSLIDFPLHKPSSAIQFWVGLGLISGLYIKHFNKPKPINKLYLVLAVFITLSFSITATVFHIKNTMGNYYHRKAVLSGNCDDARRYIDKSIKEGGFYLMSHGYRVSIHISCQTPAPVLLQIIEEELAWDPTNIKALYFRGQVLLGSGYPELALKDFKKIVSILPHRSAAKLYIAKTLIALNRTQEAKASLKHTIKEHPDFDKAKVLLNEIDQ
ncbi:MAG: O-antigen ligase family protein [Gammaproteobacteria bacterium]